MIENLFGYIQETTCRICGRPLTDPESVNRGIGPICWQSEIDRLNNELDQPTTDEWLPLDIETNGIVLERYENGIATNVPPVVVQHSPSGYEWGYGGSGPSDLALNIIQTALIKMNYRGQMMECFRGRCYVAAWAIYQKFKWQFLECMPYEGGIIRWETIQQWVANELEQMTEVM